MDATVKVQLKEGIRGFNHVKQVKFVKMDGQWHLSLIFDPQENLTPCGFVASLDLIDSYTVGEFEFRLTDMGFDHAHV